VVYIPEVGVFSEDEFRDLVVKVCRVLEKEKIRRVVIDGRTIFPEAVISIVHEIYPQLRDEDDAVDFFRYLILCLDQAVPPLHTEPWDPEDEDYIVNEKTVYEVSDYLVTCICYENMYYGYYEFRVSRKNPVSQAIPILRKLASALRGFLSKPTT